MKVLRRGVMLSALLAGAIAFGPGCGGASQTPAPANPGAAPAYEVQAPAGGTATPSATTPTMVMDANARRIEAIRSLDASTREVELSTAHDCAAACRALASMERATAQLCTIADLPEDRRRCEDAKMRLVAARDRVRGACSACPGGPSVEHDAPAP